MPPNSQDLSRKDEWGAVYATLAQCERDDKHSISFQTLGTFAAVVAAPLVPLLFGLAPFTALGVIVGGPIVLLGSASLIYGRWLRKKMTERRTTAYQIRDALKKKQLGESAQVLVAAESALDRSLTRVTPEVGLEIPVVLGSETPKLLRVETMETRKILGDDGVVSKTEITARLYDGQDLVPGSLVKGDPTPDMPTFRRVLKQDEPPGPA